MKKVMPFIPLAALIIATLACSFNFSTANIENARLARDTDGQNQTTVFVPDETVYAVLDLRNAPEDTELQAVWYAVDVPDVDADTELGRSDEIESTSGAVWFSFYPRDGWVPGTYKVEIILNTVVDQTLTFEIVPRSDTTVTDAAE